MIGDIVNGREKSKFVLIEDTVLQSGRPLLICMVQSLCQRVEKVHIICFERSPELLRGLFQVELSQRLVFHDGSSDPLGWENPENLNIDTDLVQYLNNKPGHVASNSVAIVIDSLSPMLLHRSAPYTCKTIARLMKEKIQAAEVEQIICLLHGDLHDNQSLILIEHLATSEVKVTPAKHLEFHMACNIVHKRLSGKVIKTAEHFNLDETYDIQDVTEIKAVDTKKTTIETKQPDPAANLTFNLTLTDKEKDARSQVKLPYTYDLNRQDDTLTRSVGEGKIFYQPDEADDFDEEDPDDDLDI